MSERKAPPAERQQRLRAALRENLKRRKAQARGRRSGEEKPGKGEPPPKGNANKP
jgi:hypothetical protein